MATGEWLLNQQRLPAGERERVEAQREGRDHVSVDQ
jgi:hypothetical protein